MDDINYYKPGPVRTRKLTPEEIEEHRKRQKEKKRTKQSELEFVEYIHEAQLRAEKRKRW
jgi:hypothetical protein